MGRRKPMTHQVEIVGRGFCKGAQKTHIAALLRSAYTQGWEENILGSRPRLVCSVGSISAERAIESWPEAEETKKA